MLAAMIIYGANYVISKKVTPEFVMPFGLVWFRVACALVLFYIVSALFVREKMETRDIWRCALLAVFGVTINQMLFLKGLSITSPINASLMMITTPILVLLLMAVIGKERPTTLKIAGLLLGFSGATLVITSGEVVTVKGNGSSLPGDILILCNALSWGLYLIYVKPLMKKYHTITIVKWVFFFGLIYVTPFSWNEIQQVPWEKFSTQTWWFFAYILIVTTFLAYIFNTYALKNLSPQIVSAYIYLQPFLAAVFGLMWGMDTLSTEKVLYSLLIFAGVYLVSFTPDRPKSE